MRFFKENWGSIFEENLADSCANPAKQDVVVSSLKAIGNIGHIKDLSLLEKCAAKKDNSLQIRVDAIKAVRLFSCDELENANGLGALFADREEDAEIRIDAFLSFTRCAGESEKAKKFISEKLADILLAETDRQVGLIHSLIINSNCFTTLSSFQENREKKTYKFQYFRF